jgi:hypothetical protein
MTNRNIKLENQLRSCNIRIKIGLPQTIQERFPYVLIAKGYRNSRNKLFIRMQMFKSQTENPVKDYEWKKNTDVQEAIETLTRHFIMEYIL